MISLNQLEVTKKEYFWSRSFFVLSISGASKEEEMKIIKKAYKFRIYPTLEQVIFFLKNFDCVRKVMKNINQQELKLNILLLLNIKKNILI